MKSIILTLTVCRRPLAYFCILNQNVPKYIPICLYFYNLPFNNNNLEEYYGAPTRLVGPIVGVKICEPFNYS